jgi:hypothetical protein
LLFWEKRIEEEPNGLHENKGTPEKAWFLPFGAPLSAVCRLIRR